MERCGSEKVLLLGVGETGRGVIKIIEREHVNGITAFRIEDESCLGSVCRSLIDKAEVVIMVADLGHTKKSSLAIQIAKMAKEQDKIVAAILTTPKYSEGETVVMRAIKTVRVVGHNADAVLIINKETFNSPPDAGCSFVELINSLVAVEEVIAEGIQNIMCLISESDAVKIDLDDLKISLKHCGTFSIECGFGAGKNRIELAIDSVMSSQLMKKCDILTARKVLIKLICPKNAGITMNEMKTVSEFIGNLHPHADVKWGIGETDDDVLSVIILATGFDVN